MLEVGDLENHNTAAKISIQTASTDVEALNTMLDLYRQIGLYQPPHSRYAELFKRQPEMVVVLAAVYRDIIQVQKHALQFFKQPSKPSASHYSLSLY